MDYLTKSRYFELIAKEKNLELKGTSLYWENKSEYFELKSYKIILEEQFFYENRFQYIQLIKKYIDEKINCYTFQWDFFDLYHSHLKISDESIENLNQSIISSLNSIENWSSNISFLKDSKMENFSSLLDDLVSLCNALDDGLIEDRFDLEIKKIYSNMQKFTESPSVFYDDSRVLRDRMIFFSIIIFLSSSLLNPELFNFFSNIFS